MDKFEDLTRRLDQEAQCRDHAYAQALLRALERVVDTYVVNDQFMGKERIARRDAIIKRYLTEELGV